VIPNHSNSSLILGIGNEILTDDGIGPRLVHDIEKNFAGSEVDFETCSLGGLDVMEIIKAYDQVIIIDAIRTRDGIPGDLYKFEPDDFKETLHLSNFHDVNFLTALELGNFLDMNMPSDITILAIEIVEDLEFSTEFTPEVGRRYPFIREEIISFIGEKLKVRQTIENR